MFEVILLYIISGIFLVVQYFALRKGQKKTATVIYFMLLIMGLGIGIISGSLGTFLALLIPIAISQYIFKMSKKEEMESLS